MKNFNRAMINAGFFILLFASCEGISNKVETQLNQLANKANQLDSVINTEMDKVMNLDSLINLEALQINKLDSLVEKSSSKLDSIWKKHK